MSHGTFYLIPEFFFCKGQWLTDHGSVGPAASAWHATWADICPVERESELKESITMSKPCRIASRVAHDVIVFHVERSSEMLTPLTSTRI